MNKIFYIGDSTAQFNKIDSYPQTGMSQGLFRYLKNHAQLESHAKNGRSTKSFLDEGRFEPVRQAMQPGDILLIQFGHNDEKDDPARHTDPDTTFRQNLMIFIDAARSAGAHPVLITPIARRLFREDGSFCPGSHGAYPDAVRAQGKESNVPVIDLTAITERFVASLGDEPSKPLYMWPIDNTHLKPEGAVRMAGFLAEELKKLGSPYCDFFE